NVENCLHALIPHGKCAKHFLCAVHRSIVDEHDLEADVGDPGENRAQSLVQDLDVLFFVVARHDNRDQGLRRHHAEPPPSTASSAPVMYDDASEQRNNTAPSYSSSRAILPNGIRSAMRRK